VFEGGGQGVVAGTAQPKAGIFLDIGFGDGDFDAVGINDGGECSKSFVGNFLERSRKIFAFVVGEHTFLCGVEDGEIGDKAEGSVLAENLYIFATESGFDAIGNALRIGAEDYGEAAVEVEAKFVVEFADFCEFLADDRLERFVDGILFGGLELRILAKGFAGDVDGERGVFEERLTVEGDVVGNAIGDVDLDFDAIVGRAEGETRVGGI